MISWLELLVTLDFDLPFLSEWDSTSSPSSPASSLHSGFGMLGAGFCRVLVAFFAVLKPKLSFGADIVLQM